IAKLDKYHLLILDDLAYVTKDQAETSVLFELISARYERRSMLITANQPFGEWGRIFPDQAITLASIDRLVHHSTILESRVEDGRGGLGPIGQHPVSRPRSSNRTCRFPASSSPIDLTAKLSVAIPSRRVPFAARRFLRT